MFSKGPPWHKYLEQSLCKLLCCVSAVPPSRSCLHIKNTAISMYQSYRLWIQSLNSMVDAMKLWRCPATLPSAHWQHLTHDLSIKSEGIQITKQRSKLQQEHQTQIHLWKCADASAVRFVLAVWFITSWLLTLYVEVLCSEAHRLLSSAPYTHKTPLKDCALHARCMLC